MPLVIVIEGTDAELAEKLAHAAYLTLPSSVKHPDGEEDEEWDIDQHHIVVGEVAASKIAEFVSTHWTIHVGVGSRKRHGAGPVEYNLYVEHNNDDNIAESMSYAMCPYLNVSPQDAYKLFAGNLAHCRMPTREEVKRLRRE